MQNHPIFAHKIGLDLILSWKARISGNVVTKKLTNCPINMHGSHYCNAEKRSLRVKSMLYGCLIEKYRPTDQASRPMWPYHDDEAEWLNESSEDSEAPDQGRTSDGGEEFVAC